jgi:hypothetical protein
MTYHLASTVLETISFDSEKKMAGKSGDDHVFIHHEDSASSGGPLSTHNPVARCLFLEARPSSVTREVVPPTTTSTPIATAAGGMPTYVANIRIPTTTSPSENQSLQNMQNLPAGAAVQWPLTNNFIPS